MKRMDTQEANRLWATNPEKMAILVQDMVRHWKFDFEELAPEFESGRLVTTSIRNPPRPGDPELITGDALLAWIANPQTPPDILAKLKRGMASPERGCRRWCYDLRR